MTCDDCGQDAVTERHTYAIDGCAVDGPEPCPNTCTCAITWRPVVLNFCAEHAAQYDREISEAKSE